MLPRCRGPSRFSDAAAPTITAAQTVSCLTARGPVAGRVPGARRRSTLHRSRVLRCALRVALSAACRRSEGLGQWMLDSSEAPVAASCASHAACCMLSDRPHVRRPRTNSCAAAADHEPVGPGFVGPWRVPGAEQ